MVLNTPHLYSIATAKQDALRRHVLDKIKSAAHRPFFLENFHIFYKGQCENTFINMYAGHPAPTKIENISYNGQHSGVLNDKFSEKSRIKGRMKNIPT